MKICVNLLGILKENIMKQKNNFLKKVGNNYLTEEQIFILNNYNIEYKNCTNLREIIINIDYFINSTYDLLEDEIKELDQIASELNERNYYLNTNK